MTIPSRARRYLRRGFAGAIVFGLVSLVGASPTLAMVPPTTFVRLVKRADCIAVASVDEIHKAGEVRYGPGYRISPNDQDDADVTLRPVRVLKGSIDSSVHLHLGIGEFNCVRLKAGHQYLFFLVHDQRDPGVYHDAWAGRGTMPVVMTKKGLRIIVFVADVLMPRTADPELHVSDDDCSRWFRFRSFLALVLKEIRTPTPDRSRLAPRKRP